MLGRLLNSKRLAERNRLGQQPRHATSARGRGGGRHDAECRQADPELSALFGDGYRQLHGQANANVAAGDVLGPARAARGAMAWRHISIATNRCRSSG